jgi:hypothetical protein
MTHLVRRTCLAASIALTVLALTPALAAAGRCHGVTMPPRVAVGDKTLILNGMGVREATVFNVDVYVAGLYLPVPSRSGPSVLRHMDTMQIVLKLARDVERDEMGEALYNGLRRNAGDRMPTLELRARRLQQLIPDLRKGDEVAITYLPQGEGALVFELNGERRGRVDGTDFAREFFAIWLHKPPNEELKRGLLGGACE